MKMLTKLVILAIAILVIDLSIQSLEKRECVNWQQEPRAFAEWQIEQCYTYGITLK